MLRLGQANQGLFGLLKLSRPDKEPRGLGCQECEDEQGNGPDPLNSHGDLVTPVGVVVDQALEDAGRDELTDAPAEVDVSREVSAKRQGHDLGSVSRPRCREHAPGDIAEELAD